MTDIAQRIAGLSPEKRALLEARLAQQSAQRPGVSKPIQRRADGAPLVPSFGQERLWFLEQIEGGTALYNISAALRLRGSLHLDALARAISAIVARHETLRTRYVSVDGALTLDVVEPGELAELPLPVIDTTEEGLDDALENEAGRAIALDRDLPIRAVVFRVGERDHVLQITMHHVASDGWSLGVFTRELTALYNAELTGSTAELPKLPIRYSDYAHWLRETLQGADLERLMNYWTDHLSGSPFALQLPTDHPRPAKQTFCGKQSFFSLPSEPTSALKEFCARENATPFMVLLSALYATLGRYTGQSNVLVGTPIAARTRTEMEELIGFFTNTLVMRGDLSGEPTFRDLVQRVKRVALGAYAHQDIPFEKLIEELKPERDLSRSPVFQVMFVLQNAPASGIELHGLDASLQGVHNTTSKFDLSIDMEERAGGLDAWIEYNTALFESATIDRLWAHLSTFLRNGLARPDELVARIPILSESEERQVLIDWNGRKVEYPADATLVSLFGEQVARTPSAIAVVQEGGEQVSHSISYSELDRRSDVLARFLRARGAGPAGPNVLVGVCLDRSIDLVVALLGIVKAGAAYVPLDPEYPLDRLRFMLEDSGVRLVLTQSSIAARIDSGESDSARELICLDTNWAEIVARAESWSGELASPEPDDLAYMIYTSGSTGRPKGAKNTHRAIANRLLWMQDEYALGPEDVVLQKTPFSFDVSVWEFFWPLITGARLAMATPGGHRDPTYLVDAVNGFGVTVMHFVPSMLEAFLGEPRVSECAASLRDVMCSGEALPFELQERFFDRVPGVGLHNLYGPTEAAVDVTYWRCIPGDARRVVPIGRPVANTQMYVLDAQLKPVPIGVAGDLYIGGVQVGQGYHNRAELTAERFIADPFAANRGRAGGRLYKTGDLARWLTDGSLEYLGRTDNQIKLRGFRIELGEIESAITRYDGVKQAVVVAREDKPGDKRLVAYVVYVVSESGVPSSSVTELRSFLRETLPDYMVPSAFVNLDTIPLSANGKVDRKALPAPDAGAATPERKMIRPRSYVENQLTEVWEDIFGVTSLSVEDDFFDLGGHSLLALRMMARVTQVFGKHVPLNALFESPTIAQLARHIEDAETTDGQHTLVSVQASGTKPPVFWIPGGAAFGLISLRHVVTRLGPDQPVYGLASNYPKSLTDVQTVEERARHYLELVRKFRPHGPYCFTGFCAGGKVALAMAQQLIDEGEDVPFLGLINCWFPSWPPSRMDHLRLKSQRLRYQIRGARAQGVSLTKYIRTKLADRRHAQLARLAVEARASEVKERGLQAPDETQTQVILNAVAEAFESYQVRHYPGHVSLFISQDDEDLAGISPDLDPRFAWRRHADSHDIRTFPGGHVGVVELPHAIDFAESFKAALDLALEKNVSQNVNHHEDASVA